MITIIITIESTTKQVSSKGLLEINELVNTCCSKLEHLGHINAEIQVDGYALSYEEIRNYPEKM